jgi:hypothetical protein
VKEYAHEDLSAGNGFDLGAMFGMPAGSLVIGTYYVDNGSVVIVQPGETISVTAVESGVYTIDGSTGYSFLVAPEGYVPGGLAVLNAEDTVAQDCTLEDGSTPVTDVESHTIVMKDDAGALVAQVKLVRAVGTTDLSGEYTVKEYAHEDFSAGNGFDLGVFFGMAEGAYVIGTYYMKDGAAVIVQPGETITVSKIADDTYKFEGSTDWAFVGKMKTGGEEPPVVEPFAPTEVFIITEAISDAVDETFAPVAGVKTHMLTLTNSENKEVAWFQLVLTEGETNLTGDYECKEYAHEDHTCGNGYDAGAWGQGGCRYLDAGGNLVMVTPGETVKVTSAGGVLTFSGTSFTIKGKLEVEEPASVQIPE